jgi:hypothetical protein
MSTALIHADIKACQSPTFSLVTLLNWVLDSACAFLFAHSPLFMTFSDLAHFRSFWTLSLLFNSTLARLLISTDNLITIPTGMHRYMTFARIFLILSIINFARAAPVVVRRVHEVHVNVVDVAEDGTATSEKRWDSGPSDDWLANAADQTSVPTAPRLSALDHSGLQSSTRLNNAPSSSALLTGPHPRWDGPLPLGSRASSPDSSGSNQLSANNPRPPSPDFSWPSELPANNPRPPSPDFSWPSQLPAASPNYPPPHQSADDHSLSSSEPARPTTPKTKDLLSQLNPSQDPPSPAEPETKDFLNQLGSGPSHLAEPETKDFLGQLGSGPSHVAEPETKDFLDLLLKGKIKRRISGSGAVNSAQESQATIDPRSCVFASSPSPANFINKSISGPCKFFDCSCDLRK